MNAAVPYISPKPFTEFTADEFHAHVTDMYELRAKKSSAKPNAGVPGINLSRTKRGELSLRRTKARSFHYVTMPEIKKLADFVKASQADVWNLFKRKEYIIGQTKMDCEQAYARIRGILWE